MNTPKTNARVEAIIIESEDSCCGIYVKLDGANYDGDLVDADFARGMEQAVTELSAALTDLLDEYEFQQGQYGQEYIWKKHENPEVIERARDLVARYQE